MFSMIQHKLDSKRMSRDISFVNDPSDSLVKDAAQTRCQEHSDKSEQKIRSGHLEAFASRSESASFCLSSQAHGIKECKGSGADLPQETLV